MITFWIVAAVLIAAALAVVVVPMWRTRAAATGDDARSVNVAVYRQRRAELDQDLANGTILREECDKALAEIERQLVDDATGGEGGAGVRGLDRGWILGALVVVVPALAVGLYSQVGGRPTIAGPTAPDRAGARQEAGGEDGRHDNIQAMVAGLAERLERNPDDGRGWLMLGRSYTVLERYGEAADALAQARKRLGDRPDVLTLYAQALAMSREPRSLEGEPARLLDKALEADPDRPRALWLGGVAAAQQGSYRVAIERWQRLLDIEGENGPGAEVLRENISAARARLEGEARTASRPAQAGGSADTAGGSASDGGAQAEVTVRVSLAEELADRPAAGDTVFVFARAVEGPPMPVAVARLRVSELPAEVTLGEDDAMTEQRTLADFERVAVMARVSRSGGVRASSGDLEASAQNVEVGGDEPISLRIDTVVE